MENAQDGSEKRRTWRKLHLAIDASTHEVVTAEVSLVSVGDNEVLPTLFNPLRRKIAQVSARGLVFHSDRGSQYTSKQFGRLLSSYGIRASMGDVGAYWDNAVVERFFGSLKHD